MLDIFFMLHKQLFTSKGNYDKTQHKKKEQQKKTEISTKKIARHQSVTHTHKNLQEIPY